LFKALDDASSSTQHRKKIIMMTPTTVMELGRGALEVGLLVSAPVFAAALVTGLIVSILQAATQINEMTLSFVPKLVVMFLTLLVAGPWMITILTDYIRRLYSAIPGIIG
jgi:flagellar biosynthetic protein FliQ